MKSSFADVKMPMLLCAMQSLLHDIHLTFALVFVF